MDNPYKAPTTPMKDVPPPSPRSPILAVLAGVAVDIGGTTASGLVIGLVYAVLFASQGMSPQEIGEALVEADRLSPYFTVSGLVGLGFSVLGGYVCARVARRHERRWAAIAALITVAIGLVVAGGDFRLGANAGISLLSFVGIVLGGELGRRRNLADARAAGVANAA